MSIPSGRTPDHEAQSPQDPEEVVGELHPPQGEDYGPPEVIDPDREASEADQIDQAIEAPDPDEPAGEDDQGEPDAR